MIKHLRRLLYSLAWFNCSDFVRCLNYAIEIVSYTICRDILSYVSQPMISKLMINKKKPAINPLTVKKIKELGINNTY